MNKSDLWRIYCDKNPQFANDNTQITMTVRGLKKLFDQTYDAGFEAAFITRDSRPEDSSFNDLMRTLGMTK